MAEPAGTVAGGGGDGMRTGDMQILLHRGMQVGTGEEERAGRAGETDVARCFAQDEGLREAFGRLAQFSATGLSFLCFLTTDAAGEFAFLRVGRES